MALVGNGQLGFTVLVGNPKPQSRTRTVALRAAEVLHARLAGAGTVVDEPHLVDLAELSPELIVARHRGIAMTAAYTAVTGSALLLVASPTFKGMFTGLLKLFVDVLPRQGLVGIVAVPVMTAAEPAHQHAVDSYLRPLLIALGATVSSPGLSVLEAEFVALDQVLSAWACDAVPALSGLLVQRRGEPLPVRI
jgi:FMN reductase